MRNRESLGGAEENDEINISPMIDMVFILLIFFIVTTVFVEEDGFGVDRPSPTDTPEINDEEKESVTILVDNNNQIFLNDVKVALGAIRPKVSQVLSANEDAPILVEAEDAANAGLLITVMDQARLGGAKIVSITSATD